MNAIDLYRFFYRLRRTHMSPARAALAAFREAIKRPSF